MCACAVSCVFDGFKAAKAGSLAKENHITRKTGEASHVCINRQKIAVRSGGVRNRQLCIIFISAVYDTHVAHHPPGLHRDTLFFGCLLGSFGYVCLVNSWPLVFHLKIYWNSFQSRSISLCRVETFLGKLHRRKFRFVRVGVCSEGLVVTAEEHSANVTKI